MAMTINDCRKSVSLIIIFLVIQFGVCTGYKLEDAKRLLRNRTADYEKVFRPIKDQSKTLDIVTAFDLVFVQEFDERQEKLTVTGILYTAWMDEIFAWDPKDFGDVTYLILDTTKIWTPPISLTNALEKMEKVSEDWHHIVIYSSGYIEYFAGGIFSFSCPVDVTYYPWDQQTCQMLFVLWGYGSEQLRVIQYNDNVLQNYYSENGVWTLTDSHAGVYPGTLLFFFELKLERQPRFIVINVLAPIMFMSFLNALIFLIPIESGERISYCLTVLLAIAVFLTLVGDNLPRTSDPMSLLSFYLLAVLIVSICITLATIYSLRLFHNDESKNIGAIFRFITKFFGCRYRCDARSRKHRKRNKRSYSRNSSYIHSGGRNDYVNLSKAKVWTVRNDFNMLDEERHNNVINAESEHKNYPEEDEISWKDVSMAMDRIFLIFFFTVIAILSLVFSLYTRYYGIKQKDDEETNT